MLEQGTFRLSMHTDSIPEKIATMWWLACVLDATWIFCLAGGALGNPGVMFQNTVMHFSQACPWKSGFAGCCRQICVFPVPQSSLGRVSAVWASQLIPHPDQSLTPGRHKLAVPASPWAQAELQEQKLDILLTESIFGNQRAINIRILNHEEHLHPGELGPGCGRAGGLWAGTAALAQPCQEAPAQSHTHTHNYRATS